MDLLAPRPQKPGRMGLFALARMFHKRSTGTGSTHEGYTTPARAQVTIRRDGMRMLPVPRRIARKLRSHG